MIRFEPHSTGHTDEFVVRDDGSEKIVGVIGQLDGKWMFRVDERDCVLNEQELEQLSVTLYNKRVGVS